MKADTKLIPHTAAALIAALSQAPAHYRVLICDDSDYGGSNWSDKLAVDVDHEHAVVRLWCICR